MSQEPSGAFPPRAGGRIPEPTASGRVHRHPRRKAPNIWRSATTSSASYLARRADQNIMNFPKRWGLRTVKLERTTVPSRASLSRQRGDEGRAEPVRRCCVRSAAARVASVVYKVYGRTRPGNEDLKVARRCTTAATAGAHRDPLSDTTSHRRADERSRG